MLLLASKKRYVISETTRNTPGLWTAEELGSKRDVAAVKDKSWIWKMYCLLSEDRRIQTLYPQYETLMLGAAERLEGKLRDLATQAEAGAKEKASHKKRQKKIMVNVGLGNRATTSHGQGVVVNEEVIDVELEDFTLLGDTGVQEQDIKEQLGTSHALAKEDPDRALPLEQDGSNSVVLFPAISLPIPAGKEDELHPPIRKVRSLTPCSRG